MVSRFTIPRIVTAALRGGAGKTLITVGLIGALRRRGWSVGAFKKGPDYIDTGWLGLAARGQCYNLDSYLFSPETLLSSFISRSTGKDISVVEGNRGLFDGVDSGGSYSTAALANFLAAPAVLIVDCTKMTRTAAALVLGCRVLDKDLDLRGVILNRVAGARHESVLRRSIEAATALPVVGSVHKLALRSLPQRHLGLLPFQEHPAALEFVEQAADVIERSVDIDSAISIARNAREMEWGFHRIGTWTRRNIRNIRVRIGIVRDSAFQFYYPENLEALEAQGAELIEISALEFSRLPEVDALYIGGGFPETHAERLARNGALRRSVREAVNSGLPVYAECGGFMYLCRSLIIDDHAYPMAGVFPVDTVLRREPQGLGYVKVEVTGNNPFFPVGTVINGHEFHYSSIVGTEASRPRFVLRVLRGHGMDGRFDGMCTHNALGAYLHVHALGAPQWACCLVEKAFEFRSSRTRRMVEPLQAEHY
jgi:cobyrinic acid a,c-diamide synthase